MRRNTQHILPLRAKTANQKDCGLGLAIMHDKQLRPLLKLPKSCRDTLVMELSCCDAGSKKQAYLSRKAFGKLHQLERKNRRNNIEHFKGLNSKTERLGRGKLGYLLRTFDGDEQHSIAEIVQRRVDSDQDKFAFKKSEPHHCERWKMAQEVKRLAEANYPVKRRSRPRSPLSFFDLTESSCLEDLQKCFWHNFEDQIRLQLKQIWKSDPWISEVPLSSLVTSQFLKHLTITKQTARVLPCYHGTWARYHQSIFENGFLIPGPDNGVTVRNGSANGLGIYTARVESPWLSSSFLCSDKRLLLCAVISDVSLPDPWVPETKFAMSGQVLHHYDAVVVFNPVLVVPLLQATPRPVEAKPLKPREKPGRRRVRQCWHRIYRVCCRRSNFRTVSREARAANRLTKHSSWSLRKWLQPQSRR